MEACKIIVVVVLVHVFWMPAHAGPGWMHQEHNFCGRKLTSAMALVCKGNYNGPSKKSVLDPLGEYDEDDGYELPLFPKDYFLDFSLKHLGDKRARTGIIQECCDKPCSYNHLSSYCA